MNVTSSSRIFFAGTRTKTKASSSFCTRFITATRLQPSRRIHQKYFLLLLFLLFCGYLGLQYYTTYYFAFWNPKHPNYFIDPNEFQTLGFTVNTPSCKILNLSAWDKSTISLVHSPTSHTNCYDAYKHWTYVNGSNIIVNGTAVEESGYSMNSIECCYRVISRVEQKIEKYNELADSVTNISDTCEPLNNQVNPVTAEFVRVKCIAKYWPAFRDVVYRNYHALAQPNRSRETLEKINLWAKQASTDSPPHVLVLGIDSMSRLNFVRTMKKTRRYLEQIGAVELLGYTKIGENTFPNAVVLLSGYNEEDIQKICYPTPYTAQDSCPYIWKRFNEAKYLTAHLEDMPGLQIFNRLKTGFVQQQVDFYLRPFMLDLFGPIYEKECIGPETQDQKIFNYITNIRKLAFQNNVPTFIFTWITNLAHRDLNAAKNADDSYEDFLRNLDLSNTILFFISDHGFRYGAFRETFAGWFEDKLPNFWVYLPPPLRNKYPIWYQKLRINSVRLVSPYDFYHTLNHILEEFSHIAAVQESVVVVNGTNVQYPRNIGQSFFEEVPESRKCSDAGIQNHFCPCATPKKVLLTNSHLYKAASASVDFINKLLPPQCSKLNVTELTAGGSLDDKDEVNSKTKDEKQSLSYYVVAFIADPGHFLFEATVEYNETSENFQVSGNVLRMNKMIRDVSCVNDVEIEKLCYCSS